MYNTDTNIIQFFVHCQKKGLKFAGNVTDDYVGEQEEAVTIKVAIVTEY